MTIRAPHIAVPDPLARAARPDRFARPPLLEWHDAFEALGLYEGWPSVERIDALREHTVAADGFERPQFVIQSPALLADGLHYEQRIGSGRIATRERNWHDLLNALIWLRYPGIKSALNAAQCTDIAVVGSRQRTRAQCAMTHFDEGGAVVLCSDPALIGLWDQHDWHDLFWRERSAWGRRIAVLVFGHALLELALQPERLLLAKAIVLQASPQQVQAVADQPVESCRAVDARIAEMIRAGSCLRDPQALRPLPLSGIPGWHDGAESESFYVDARCFRPLREGRRYPVPMPA
jgi:hypothetical protein